VSLLGRHAARQLGVGFNELDHVGVGTNLDASRGDDLIRHPFPYEPITREQFEIGGGTSHELWDWFRNDTRERIRTGGWAVVTGTTTDKIYAGCLTLGDLDSDAQVYYLQVPTGTAPVDFILPGAVNQAVEVFDNGGQDLRSFLNLYVRKKFRSYAQSDIAAIGVNQLESLLNRFPLTHVPDSAIVARDAELVGNTPWTGYETVESGVSGTTSDQGSNVGRLTDDLEDFTAAGVVVGDVLNITNGSSDDGYYEVVAVGTTTVDLDTEEAGAFVGEGSLTYDIRTRTIITEIADDGTISQDTPVSPTGTLVSIAGGFSGPVAADDILRITEDGATRGVYQITAVVSDTEIQVDTSDQAFPTGAIGNIDYEILEPGMFLQYKNQSITLAATGDLTFSDESPSEDRITRTSNSWITDDVQVGDLITIAGSNSNDGDYVVRTIVSALIIEVDIQHTLTAEGPVGATATVSRPFIRSINSIDYPFHWRLFGNDAGAGDIFEFVQRELRRATDIDEGPAFSRGDITDLLMTFATPTG
ncbi:hypothetical protein LCGC14_2414410, partial [marine sediment metagenome]